MARTCSAIDCFARLGDRLSGSLLALAPPIRASVQPLRQIAVDRIVRRGLVGDARPAARRAAPVRARPRRHCRAAPTETAFFSLPARVDDRQRLVEILRLHVEIAGAQAHLDALGWHSTARHEAPAMVAASGCAPPMPPRPAVRIQRPARLPPIMLAAHLDEGLVGALHDALAADVDPRAGRHLAVHHQALAIELVEMLPGRPVRHEVGVGDQHARRIGMGAEHADRLAGLHQQRLVGFELAQRRDDAVEALPVARRTADAAIDHELAAASRRRRDRDCSSACAAALRSASSWR